MDLRHIRYFVAAVEEGSLQAAARRLHIAQPALSRRIRDLESSMSCDLLVRAARGVTPTRAGASFYRDALTLLDALEAARRRAGALGREKESVARIGLMPTARKYPFLAEALMAPTAGASAVPLVYDRAASADLATRLRDGKLDIALLYERRMADAQIRERLIHQERYLLALHPSHVLARVEAPTFADLEPHPLVWLSRQDDAAHHDRLLQQCRLHGFDPLIAHSAGGHEEQIDIAVVSGGAFLTPASTILSTPPGMLVFRVLDSFAMALSLTLAWREAVEDAPAGAVLADLHGAIERHQAAVREGKGWAILGGHRIVTAA